MRIKTRIFELNNGQMTMQQLADAMDIGLDELWDVKRGKEPNIDFVAGGIKAFPERRIDELFYLKADE